MSRKNNKLPRLRFPEFRGVGDWEEKEGNLVFEQISNKKHDSNLPVLAITQEHGAIPRVLIDFHVSVTDKSIKNYKVVEEGDFIISLRTFQGGIEHSKYKGICSPAYVILRKSQSNSRISISGEFFKYYFKTGKFIRDLSKNIEGLRDGKMVSYKQFSALMLPIPLVEEQQKIAACLSSLDDLITAQTQKLAHLKTHKKGLMQQLFPAEGETQPKLRFPEFRNAGDWNVFTIEEIGDISSGGTPSRKNHEYWNGDIPWVSTTLIGSNTIKTVNEYITKTGLQNSSAKVFPKTTILMAMYGQGKTRGKVAMLGINAAINQACAAITLKESVNTDFVFQNLNARYEEIRKISNQGGQENLSGAIIKKILIPIPPKKSEQQKIADCLSSLDELITAQGQKLAHLKTHKKGLMQQLFPAADEVNR